LFLFGGTGYPSLEVKESALEHERSDSGLKYLADFLDIVPGYRFLSFCQPTSISRTVFPSLLT